MKLWCGMPNSGTETTIGTGSTYSWHADHYLVAAMARGGLFWSATVRLDAAASKSEPRAASDPEPLPAVSRLVGWTPPGFDGSGTAAAAVPYTTIVEPLVMASLCDLLYDDAGQTSKPDWTPEEWDAALQQQSWTASWQFLAESSANPQMYFGVAFENIATGQIVIANRGTQTAYDLLVSDIDILRGIIPPAFFAAQQFASQVVSAHLGSGQEIFVTGHSLGGADAQYQAAMLGLTGATFAALGAKFAAPQSTPDLINYLYPQDAVANLAPHIGTVEYIQPNGPAQWIDLIATWRFEAEGLHFINNYLEHFGAPGIEPITPIQFIEAVVLAEVVEIFSQKDDAALARLTEAAPQLGFNDLAWPGAPAVASNASSARPSSGDTVDWALAAALFEAALSMPAAAADLRAWSTG